jgi:fibronectin type 3 domain-containing protein
MKRLAILALVLVSACKIPIGAVPCNADSQCASDQICGSDGTCQPAPFCHDGERLCGQVCTDITSATNCGACGNVCATGLSCISGVCAIPLRTAVISAPAYADQLAMNLAATVTSNDANATYAWTISGGTFADGTLTATGAAVTFNAGTGAYVTLQAVGSNNAGEHSTGSATVNLVAPLPISIAITTDSVVTANQANIAASVTSIPSTTYAWTILNGTLAASSGTNVTYTAGPNGQVTLSVTATSLSGSTANGQKVIQIAPAPGSIAITTVPSAPVGQSGIPASVTAQSGVTLVWGITGGTFADQTSSATGASVLYTAGLGPAVVLTVTATNLAGAVQNGAVTVPVTIGTPANLIATGAANQISLRWDGVAGATKYHVLRADSAGGAPKLQMDASTTNAVDASLPNGKRYYYQVEAATNFIDGAPSMTQSAVTTLPAPTNLKATGGATVALTWTGTVNATHYTVFRKTGAANYAAVGSSNAVSFTDSTGLVQGLTYTYVVHALTADNESADSNSASAVTTLAAPSGLAATVSGYDITLTWNANAAATGYDILRSTSPSGPFTVIDSVTSATYCNCATTSSPPQPATTYYYEVRATTASAVSPVSNVASATTVFPPPGSLSYTLENRNTVVLNWECVTGAMSYSVLRATSPNGPFVEISQTAACTYTDANLPYGTTFYYEVEVISPAGNSQPSPVVSLTTDASPYKSGAGLFGGEVQAVAFAPLPVTPARNGAGSVTAWIGVQGGAGAYTSTDSGATWTAAGTGLGAASVHSLVFSNGTLFAGTRGSGIYKLAPGSNTWTASSSGLVTSDTYTSMVADAAGSGTIYTSTYSKIYMSANNGTSWSATAFAPTAPVVGLAISPANPHTLFAATDGAGVYTSTDSGATWTSIGPAQASVQGGVVVDPANASHMWIGTSNGVQVTSDGGQTWAAVGNLTSVRSIAYSGGKLFASSNANGISFSDGSGGFTSIGNYSTATQGVMAMAISGSTVIAGSLSGAGVFRSADSGTTWASASSGLNAPSAPAVAVAKSAPTNLYGVIGYNVVKSADKGANWTTAMGRGISYPVITSAIAVDPSASGTVYLGAQGVLRSTDSGATWTSTNANFVANSIALASSSTAYAAVYDVGVYKSTNVNAGNPTWTAVTAGMTAQGMRVVAVAPSAAAKVYAAGDHGFWASADSGTTWTGAASQLQFVRAISVHPSLSGTVYAVVAGGVSGSQVRKSVDSGATWTDLGFGSTAAQNLTSIAIDPTNPNIIYALGTSSNGGLGGLYKSTNAGGVWVDVSSGLGTRHLRGVTLDPTTSGTLFVGSEDNGLLVSTSGGL